MFSKAEHSIGWMMFDKFKQKYSKPSLKLAGVLWLTIILQLGFLPVIAAAEETISGAQITPCSHIKPFKDADELMYQLYLSLEDDCLFKMDPKELSKIWGIPTMEIIDNRKPIENNYLKEVREPLLAADHGHLLLRVGYHPDYPYISGFSIRRVNDNDYNNYPFFPHNEYPKLLPEPFLCFNKGKELGPLPPQRGKYIGNQTLAWFNADKTRMLYLTSSDGIVYGFCLYDFVTKPFLNYCHYEEDWEY